MVRSLYAFLLLPFVGCSSVLLPEASEAPVLENVGEVVAGEFIVGEDLPESLGRELGLEELDYADRLGAGLYRADADTDLWTLSVALRQAIRPDVLVEHNRPRALARVMDDTYRGLQWNLDQLDMDRAWDRSTGAGVTVAVIDTGVSQRGEDAPANVRKGWDFIGNDADPHDENGHGTHVAGTVAQRSDNGLGCSGVAPDATILAIRVLDRNGGGSSWGVIQGIEYATDNGADVINMSLGSSSSTTSEQNAIRDAVAAGVVVVAASGNEGRGTVSYPGAYPDVIAVGAVGADGSVAGYSNGGTALDVVAPGGDLGRDVNGDGYGDGILQETVTGYEFFEGTSMAAPHVAGIAALLLSEGARPDEIRDLLVATASGNGAFSTRSGYGLVDPVAALDAVSGGGSAPPTGPAPDLTAPEITGVWGNRSGASLTVGWTTDEPATTEVEFDGFGRFGDGSGLKTEHELSFTIDSRASYTFTAIGVDASGNEGTNGKWNSFP